MIVYEVTVRNDSYPLLGITVSLIGILWATYIARRMSKVPRYRRLGRIYLLIMILCCGSIPIGEFMFRLLQQRELSLQRQALISGEYLTAVGHVVARNGIPKGLGSTEKLSFEIDGHEFNCGLGSPNPFLSPDTVLPMAWRGDNARLLYTGVIILRMETLENGGKSKAPQPDRTMND